MVWLESLERAAVVPCRLVAAVAVVPQVAVAAPQAAAAPSASRAAARGASGPEVPLSAWSAQLVEALSSMATAKGR